MGIQFCASDGLKNERESIQSGLDQAQAHELSTKVNGVESSLPKPNLKQLSKFQGSEKISLAETGR